MSVGMIGVIFTWFLKAEQLMVSTTGKKFYTYLRKPSAIKGYCLMQDGATPHTAGPYMCQIEKTINDVWKDWPGNSLDLNPIENVWALLRQSV